MTPGASPSAPNNHVQQEKNMSTFLKDPGATLDYTIDWGAGYLDAATLTASTWTVLPVEPGGLAIGAQIQSATRTSVTLAGGVPGHFYRVANQVVMSDGKSDERSVSVRVEQR
jgi:hypothetical protein